MTIGYSRLRMINSCLKRMRARIWVGSSALMLNARMNLCHKKEEDVAKRHQNLLFQLTTVTVSLFLSN